MEPTHCQQAANKRENETQPQSPESLEQRTKVSIVKISLEGVKQKQPRNHMQPLYDGHRTQQPSNGMNSLKNSAAIDKPAESQLGLEIKGLVAEPQKELILEEASSSLALPQIIPSSSKTHSDNESSAMAPKEEDTKFAENFLAAPSSVSRPISGKSPDLSAISQKTKIAASYLEGKEGDPVGEMTLSMMMADPPCEDKTATANSREYLVKVEDHNLQGFIAISKDVAEQPKTRIDTQSAQMQRGIVREFETSSPKAETPPQQQITSKSVQRKQPTVAIQFMESLPTPQKPRKSQDTFPGKAATAETRNMYNPGDPTQLRNMLSGQYGKQVILKQATFDPKQIDKPKIFTFEEKSSSPGLLYVPEPSAKMHATKEEGEAYSTPRDSNKPLQINASALPKRIPLPKQQATMLNTLTSESSHHGQLPKGTVSQFKKWQATSKRLNSTRMSQNVFHKKRPSLAQARKEGVHESVVDQESSGELLQRQKTGARSVQRLGGQRKRQTNHGSELTMLEGSRKPESMMQISNKSAERKSKHKYQDTASRLNQVYHQPKGPPRAFLQRGKGKLCFNRTKDESLSYYSPQMEEMLLTVEDPKIIPNKDASPFSSELKISSEFISKEGRTNMTLQEEHELRKEFTRLKQEIEDLKQRSFIPAKPRVSSTSAQTIQIEKLRCQPRQGLTRNTGLTPGDTTLPEVAAEAKQLALVPQSSIETKMNSRKTFQDLKLERSKTSDIKIPLGDRIRFPEVTETSFFFQDSMEIDKRLESLKISRRQEEAKVLSPGSQKPKRVTKGQLNQAFLERHRPSQFGLIEEEDPSPKKSHQVKQMVRRKTASKTKSQNAQELGKFIRANAIIEETLLERAATGRSQQKQKIASSPLGRSAPKKVVVNTDRFSGEKPTTLQLPSELESQTTPSKFVGSVNGMTTKLTPSQLPPQYEAYAQMAPIPQPSMIFPQYYISPVSPAIGVNSVAASQYQTQGFGTFNQSTITGFEPNSASLPPGTPLGERGPLMAPIQNSQFQIAPAMPIQPQGQFVPQVYSVIVPGSMPQPYPDPAHAQFQILQNQGIMASASQLRENPLASSIPDSSRSSVLPPQKPAAGVPASTLPELSLRDSTGMNPQQVGSQAILQPLGSHRSTEFIPVSSKTSRTLADPNRRSEFSLTFKPEDKKQAIQANADRKSPKKGLFSHRVSIDNSLAPVPKSSSKKSHLHTVRRPKKRYEHMENLRKSFQSDVDDESTIKALCARKSMERTGVQPAEGGKHEKKYFTFSTMH